ncbi:MAG: M36 family metallopeptidase, partial [Myxococcales bacterium]|nr:M36 family metallopeptidase [Myxococcales bacterium]
MADFSPHPTGEPDGSQPGYASSTLVTVQGLNHNPQGSSDPWAPLGSTATFGNNVWTYADINDSNAFEPGTDIVGSGGLENFDRTYDFDSEPDGSSNQVQAALIDLFYTLNWLHDWYYESGFDEGLGATQTDNFGRGGVEGDELIAELDNDGLLSTTQISVPADGISPRLELGRYPGPGIATLSTNTDGEITPIGTAGFGPQEFDLTGGVVLGDDGTNTNSDGCEPLVNNVAGQIVLVDRGGCNFLQKTQNAQAAGAIGVIMANNAGDAAVNTAGTDPSVTIPTLNVSLAAG